MNSEDTSERLQSQRRSLTLQVLSIVWNMLLNVRSLTRLVRLLRLEPFCEVWHYNPRFAIKCLGHNYLARDFDSRRGVECFLHHYQRVHSTFPSPTLKMILHWDIPLFQTTDDGHTFSIDLGTSRPYDKEGELSLLLRVDAMNIFNLTFTIVPGAQVGSEAAEALLVSRLQGEKSSPDAVRLATKAMCNVRPRALLFAALQGVGRALGVEEIDAVGGREQSSYCGNCESSFRNGYDEFFSEIGLQKNHAGHFFSQIPIPEKPLELIDRNNRRTAKKKQALKAHVREVCAESIWRASGGASEHVGTPQSQDSEPLRVEVSTVLSEL